jgi:hypothetical protein
MISNAVNKLGDFFSSGVGKVVGLGAAAIAIGYIVKRVFFDRSLPRRPDDLDGPPSQGSPSRDVVRASAPASAAPSPAAGFDRPVVSAAAAPVDLTKLKIECVGVIDNDVILNVTFSDGNGFSCI